eukprot:GILK01002192.1.p1 GENE.GILK01002192.1~~GILK01002192.1.p1  ORF type:complete len:313 (+),score=53.59 GILK01002192.1:45-941(+)
MASQNEGTTEQTDATYEMDMSNDPYMEEERFGAAAKKWKNKQRTLVFCARGIIHRYRHLMEDLRVLLPHSKKEVKFDKKENLRMINEIAEMKSCNNCIFLESRKRQDLYMWISRAPSGPSIKFHVLNVHTMSEMKLTGNCLKGSRPLLVFDNNFDTEPHWQLIKELLSQTFGTPRNHPKSKPFYDHVFSFFIADNRIWFRNYQIIETTDDTSKTTGKDCSLVEIGPRFVLNPVRMFEGSFGGPTLWANPLYVSPNAQRAAEKSVHADKYRSRVAANERFEERKKARVMPEDELDSVFK